MGAERNVYLRYGTDDESPGAHTEICVVPGDSISRIWIQDIPGSIEIELAPIPTKDLAQFAKRLAEALGDAS